MFTSSWLPFGKVQYVRFWHEMYGNREVMQNITIITNLYWIYSYIEFYLYAWGRFSFVVVVEVSEISLGWKTRSVRRYKTNIFFHHHFTRYKSSKSIYIHSQSNNYIYSIFFKQNVNHKINLYRPLPSSPRTYDKQRWDKGDSWSCPKSSHRPGSISPPD